MGGQPGAVPDQSPFRRSDDRLELAVDVELCQDALLVPPAGAEPDPELLCNRLRIVAACHQAEHLELARRQRTGNRPIDGVRLVGHHDRLEGGQLDNDLAVPRGANGAQHRVDRITLAHEPARTRRRAAVTSSGRRDDPVRTRMRVG